MAIANVLFEAFKAGEIVGLRECSTPEPGRQQYDFPSVQRGDVVKSTFAH